MLSKADELRISVRTLLALITSALQFALLLFYEISVANCVQTYKNA